MVNLILRALLANLRVFQRLRLSADPSGSNPRETLDLLPVSFTADWYDLTRLRVVLGVGEYEQLLRLDLLHDVSICPHCGSPEVRKKLR